MVVQRLHLWPQEGNIRVQPHAELCFLSERERFEPQVLYSHLILHVTRDVLGDCTRKLCSAPHQSKFERDHPFEPFHWEPSLYLTNRFVGSNLQDSILLSTFGDNPNHVVDLQCAAFEFISDRLRLAWGGHRFPDRAKSFVEVVRFILHATA